MHNFANNILHGEMEPVHLKIRDLRVFRDNTHLQNVFAAAVETYGLNRPLYMVATQIPALMDLFDERQLPSLENLDVVGDKSVTLKEGIGDRTLKSAGVQDWLEDAKDSVANFSETAQYHIAGIKARLAENADRILHSGISSDARVNAPSYEDRLEDVRAITEAIALLNAHRKDGTSIDEAASKLLRATNICQMGDDYERSPEGMYCLERFKADTLEHLGYTEDNLPHLLNHAQTMLEGARELIYHSGDILEAKYKEDTEEGKDKESEDSDISEETKDQKTQEPENVSGRYDVEHPSNWEVDHREEDVEARRPHVPLKVDPERDELAEAHESLEESNDTESLDTQITHIANHLTILCCAIDCATHVGLHLLYVSDKALVH